MKGVVVRLGDVARIFNGKTPAKSEQRDSGHPVLKIRDVSEHGAFRGTFDSFIAVALAEKHSGRWIVKGDTLILNAAHNAAYVASKMFLANAQVEGALATGEWLLVRPDQDAILPEYAHFWLKSPRVRASIRAMVKGIHLYPKDVSALNIPQVPLDEQRRIVDILMRAEGVVRLRREASVKAAELIPAIFDDMFGDPVTNPKKWPIVPLNYVAEIISGATKGRRLAPADSIALPYMRVANVKDGYLDLTEIKTISIKHSEVDNLRLKPGDLLMTEGGDPDKLGRAALWRGEIDLCVHQNHVFKVRGNRSRVLPEYLRALAGSPYGKAYFLSVAKKTTGIASINKTQLSQFPVLVPPMPMQDRFCKACDSAVSIQAQQENGKTKSDQIFAAILARAFPTGAT